MQLLVELALQDRVIAVLREQRTLVVAARLAESEARRHGGGGVENGELLRRRNGPRGHRRRRGARAAALIVTMDASGADVIGLHRRRQAPHNHTCHISHVYQTCSFPRIHRFGVRRRKAVADGIQRSAVQPPPADRQRHAPSILRTHLTRIGFTACTSDIRWEHHYI